MFRGVVFDFDGVVVDSHPVHKRAWERFLDSVGRVASEQELQFVLDGRTRDEILRHFLGEMDNAKIVEYGHQKEQFFRDEAANVQTITGLRSFLQNLEEAHLALGIASSGSRGRVDFLLDRLNLKKHFRVIVTGDEVAHGKPHPAVFLKAAQRLRTDPCDLIAFEDAFSGVKAAKSAGMTCIGIAQADRTSILLDAGAAHVVPDFQSLSYLKLQDIFRSTLGLGDFSSADNAPRSLPD
jgi:HAD superfamily hydrolase (TIGR01509 family)